MGAGLVSWPPVSNGLGARRIVDWATKGARLARVGAASYKDVALFFCCQHIPQVSRHTIGARNSLTNTIDNYVSPLFCFQTESRGTSGINTPLGPHAVLSMGPISPRRVKVHRAYNSHGETNGSHAEQKPRLYRVLFSLDE